MTGFKPNVLTMGEPAGIGGELTLMAWSSYRREIPPFFTIDDPDRLRTIATEIGIEAEIAVIARPEEAAAVYPGALPVLPLNHPVKATPGHVSVANAPAVIESIERGVDLTLKGAAGAVVTNPIQKDVLYEAGFRFPGHTEYLAELAGGGMSPVMMLASPMLRVVPVTVHVPLRRAIDTLDTESIVRQGRITLAALERDFGIARPRLAIAGLNPHAGESGNLGDDEQTIIQPAIDTLRAGGADVIGPVPPDALFTPGARTRYDAALCMYHDQALIPIKTLDFERAVNVTLGLPIVRTSPDHGTALDIAGTGKADPSSLIAALRMAVEISENRRRDAAA